MNNGMFSAMQPRSSTASAVPNYGAGVVTNPRILPQVISGNHLYTDSSGAGAALQNTPPLDHGSVAITGTSDVVLFSVTGSGFLYDIITPNGPFSGLGGPGAVVTIIVDGVPTVITSGALLAGHRLFIGAMIDVNGASARLLAPVGKHPQSSYIQVPAMNEVDSKSMPRLRFEKSLSVILKVSTIPAVNGSFGNHAMWRYRFD